MCLGHPVCLDPSVPLSSIGIDCHSAGSSSLLEQMRLALSLTRGANNNKLISAGKFPSKLDTKVEDAFNLATIKGARAVGMAQDLGSIEKGKLADLVIIDTETPVMACAAQHNPVVALVKHAGTREVDMVIVGGRIVKSNGKLRDVNLAKGLNEGGFKGDIQTGNSESISWTDVLKQLIRSRDEIQKRIETCNVDIARDMLMGMMAVKPETFV